MEIPEIKADCYRLTSTQNTVELTHWVKRIQWSLPWLLCPYCSQLFKLFTKLCSQHKYHYLFENIKLLPACFSLFLKQLRWVSGSMWYGTRKIRSQSSKKELTVLPEKRTSLQSPFRKDTSDCIFNAFEKVKLL